MKLFTIGKVGVTLDSIVHKLEKRKGGEVKVIELKCRVQPFSGQHAAAMPDAIKPLLFSLTTGEPKPAIGELVFAIPVERQNIEVFATPDTVKASILLDQVKISRVRARTEKGAAGFVLTFSATFSEDNSQLIFVNDWRTTMRFLTFAEAEPSTDFVDEEEDTDEEDDDKPGPRPAPMFDDDPPASPPPPKRERANRKPISHAAGKQGARKRR